MAVNGDKLNPSDPANPCGLVAMSFFNDSYSLLDEDGEIIPIDSNDIAWETDVKDKYV